jgi:hypothetical protein
MSEIKTALIDDTAVDPVLLVSELGLLLLLLHFQQEYSTSLPTFSDFFILFEWEPNIDIESSLSVLSLVAVSAVIGLSLQKRRSQAPEQCGDHATPL